MLPWFHHTLYFRISAEQIVVLHAESGRQIGESPTLATTTRRGKLVVLAAGQEALALSDQNQVTLSNGFQHPRTLLADFAVAELTLKYLAKKALPQSVFAVAPVIVLHPLTQLEGGLTPIEIRAFAELGALIGARKVYVWTGAALSNEDLTTRTFPNSKGQLLFP